MTVTTDREAMLHCRELVLGYHHAIDSGRATAGIGAFADDAEFEAHGRVFRGREEVLGFLTEREAKVDRHTVHMIVNDTTAVRGQAIEMHAVVLLNVRRVDGSYGLERVLDTVHTFRQVEGNWRIASRTSRQLHPDTPPTEPRRSKE